MHAKTRVALGDGIVTQNDQGRLIGWKAIGSFLGRDQRTVRRWEAERGLPINRLPGGGGATVWADPAALRAWLQGHEADAPAAEPTAEPIVEPPKNRRVLWLALGSVALIAAVPLGWRALATGDDNVVGAKIAPAPYGNDQAANAQYRDARFSLSRRSVNGLVAASGSFNDLVNRYPKVAAGYAGQAEVALLLREFGSMPNEVAYRRAIAGAQNALALDPKSPVATRALAFALFHGEGKRAEALLLFARAIQLDPSQAQSYHWYGTALISDGRPKEALAALETARALDPGSTAIVADTAYVRYVTGKTADAVRELVMITRVDPQFAGAWSYLARFALIEKRDADFLKAAATDAQLRDDKARMAEIARAAAAHARGGRTAMLASLLGDEQAHFDQAGDNALKIALLYAVSGDGDSVLRWLSKAGSNGEPHARDHIGYAELVPYRNMIDADPALRTAGN